MTRDAIHAQLTKDYSGPGLTATSVRTLCYTTYLPQVERMRHPEFRAAKYGPEFLLDPVPFRMIAAERWGGT